MVRIDPESGWVYYIASPDSPVDRYLYRSRLDGRGKTERITPADAPAGHHGYMISPDAKYAMHTFSNSETPTVYEIVTLPGHKTVRTLEDNHELAERFAAVNPGAKEFFRVDIGDVVLDGWMIKPTGFDSTAKYPVIFYIYGEPWQSTVQNSWSGGDLWSRFLAQEGYIVMSIDPRGVATPRGREWRKCVYGKVGIIPPADHAAGHLGLERRRLVHRTSDVQIPLYLLNRDSRGRSIFPVPLRHHLPGKVHGAALHQSAGIP